MSNPRHPQQSAEAARYALLRRLAYAMRHHMVVHLQPIGMIMEVMERRLAAPEPDLRQIHESMGKVHTHARAAVQSSLDVVAWLAPEEGQLVAPDVALQECYDLLRSHLNFRGFVLQNNASALTHHVSRAAMRSILPAVLLALTDHGKSPADIAMDGTQDLHEVRVTIDMRPRPGSPGFSGAPHYRLLEWSDVEAIAQAEGLELERSGDFVTITFPA